MKLGWRAGKGGATRREGAVRAASGSSSSNSGSSRLEMVKEGSGQLAWLPKLPALFAGILISSQAGPSLASVPPTTYQTMAVPTVSQLVPSLPASLASIQAPPLAALGFSPAKDAASLKGQLDNSREQLLWEQRQEETTAKEIQDLQAQLSAREWAGGQASGSGPGVSGVAGIVMLGAAGAFTATQKKSWDEAEGGLSSSLEAEEKAAGELKALVGSMQATLREEEKVVAELRMKMQSASSSNSKVLFVERSGRESAQRAAQQSEKALAAERARAMALETQSSTAAASIVQEQATQRAAKESTAALGAQLKELNRQLGRERSMAMKVGMDAMGAIEQVKRTQERMGAVVITGQKLAQVLAVEQLRRNGAESEVDVLQQQMALARGEEAESQDLANRLHQDSQRMKGEMSDLRSKLAQLFSQISADAVAAAAELAGVKTEVAKANAKLAVGMDGLATANQVVASLRNSIKDSQTQSASLEAELSKQATLKDELSSQIKAVHGQMGTTINHLDLQTAANGHAIAEASSLQEQLGVLRTKLGKHKKELHSVQAANAEIERSKEACNKESELNRHSIQEEADLSEELRRQAEALQLQSTDEKNTTIELKKQSESLAASLADELSTAVAKAEKAEGLRKQAEDVAQALSQEIEGFEQQLNELERVNSRSLDQTKAIRDSYQKEMSEAKAQCESMEAAMVESIDAEKAKVAKMLELQGAIDGLRKEVTKAVDSCKDSTAVVRSAREKRMAAENSLSEVREQLALMLAGNAAAKESAAQNLKLLKGRHEDFRRRLANQSVVADKVVQGRKKPEHSPEGA